MPFCHIWYNHTQAPIVSKVSGFGKVDARLGGYPNPEKRLLDAYLLSGEVPEAVRHRLPVSVSLLTTKCPGNKAASNNLRIFSKKYTHYSLHIQGVPKKRNFEFGGSYLRFKSTY